MEDAFKEAEVKGQKVKMLVFTNPNNPTGTVSSEEEMRIVLAFCRRHNIHLVPSTSLSHVQFSDEIYALSVKSAKEQVVSVPRSHA